jgi:hypothetical protein
MASAATRANARMGATNPAQVVPAGEGDGTDQIKLSFSFSNTRTHIPTDGGVATSCRKKQTVIVPMMRKVGMAFVSTVPESVHVFVHFLPITLPLGHGFVVSRFGL